MSSSVTSNEVQEVEETDEEVVNFLDLIDQKEKYENFAEQLVSSIFNELNISCFVLPTLITSDYSMKHKTRINSSDTQLQNIEDSLDGSLNSFSASHRYPRKKNLFVDNFMNSRRHSADVAITSHLTVIMCF
jgi:hypothetical protein